ncbi:MAG: hypothetical protein ACM3Q1_01310 [Bacteroidales bacterium]
MLVMRLAMVGALLVPLPTLAADGAGFDAELRRFRSELQGDEPVLSPGIAGHLQREADRLERMADRDQAARELRALEADTAFQVTGLPGAVPRLTGPQGRFPNIYAPSATLSSPEAWRLPEPGAGWR